MSADAGAGTALRSLSYLTPGNFPDDDPYAGLEATLQLYELGEELGYDGAWIRQRHLEHGVSSAATFLAAATQRTQRIELGTAVIPIGYESPFRLAEDLATVDVLSRGRLQAGFSAGVPPHTELMAGEVFDGDWREYDLSYGRISRLQRNLSGRFLGDPGTVVVSPGNTQRPRLQPHSPGLVDRLWYGAGSASSARWAGANGLHLLTGNVVSGEGTDDFVTAQLALLRAFREAAGATETARAKGPARRVAVGRVVIPLDGADAVTRTRFREYAASRHARTLAPQGERRTLFAPDVVGTADEIVERLAADPVVAGAAELRLELPYELDRRDYDQILHDVVRLVAPGLGRPSVATVLVQR
jgi:alkanesulfonate monooxygenase SsuD/methylene tetrahydromethanopterin reductase-like flavin-dependent oxidoreductase (luciferase family)